MSMKVISLQAFGGTENFEEAQRDIPPLEKGKGVRIRIKAAAFNPVDYKRREGKFGQECPLILGGDAAGVVDAVGEEVKGFKVGDEVYAFIFGDAASNGSYAEYVTVSEHLVAKKAKNLDFSEAASLPIVALTTYNAVFERTKIAKDDAVFVAGASGGTGSLAVQFLKVAGANPIICTAGSDESAEYLHSHLGIPRDHIVRHENKSVEELSDAIKKLTKDKKGVRHAFDLVGGKMKTLCFHVVGIKGKILSIVEEDNAEFKTPLYPSQNGLDTLFMKDADFCTVFVGAAALFLESDQWKFYGEAMHHITQLYETEQIKAPRVTVLGPMSVDAVAKAHKQLETGSTKGKLVMTV